MADNREYGLTSTGNRKSLSHDVINASTGGAGTMRESSETAAPLNVNCSYWSSKQKNPKYIHCKMIFYPSR
jgi:hypothetical protein